MDDLTMPSDLQFALHMRSTSPGARIIKLDSDAHRPSIFLSFFVSPAREFSTLSLLESACTLSHIEVHGIATLLSLTHDIGQEELAGVTQSRSSDTNIALEYRLSAMPLPRSCYFGTVVNLGMWI